MKTLIFIHGGESFADEQDYQKFLKEIYIQWQSEVWTPEVKSNWVQEIAKKWYANGDQVFMPVFPNKLNAKYREWKIVFEGILSKLTSDDEITFVGGSLGGCFLLKYFAECSVIPGLTHDPDNSNDFVRMTGLQSSQEGQKRIQINQIHLIAACISEGDFSPPQDYSYLQSLRDRIHIWHAQDDMIVPFSVGEILAEMLPEAVTHFFTSEKEYGHFYGLKEIPELEEVILPMH